LRAQVTARANSDQPPADAMDSKSLENIRPAALVTSVDAPASGSLTVPEDVRQQIHKEVRLSIAQHAHSQPLALGDIVNSGYARIYIFQVAGALDTASVVTGDGCALGSGDLISFAALGDSQQHPTAQMKVVATRAGHCLIDDTIEISVSDLQDMLNAFNERLEGNIQKLHSCVAAKDGCVRT
jgi:hypothetical protein